MKSLLMLVLSLSLLAGCKSQPSFTDNGNPGQIKAVVFVDDNRNGTIDSGETGAQMVVGISQDISCPPSSMDKITSVTADTNGFAWFNDLKPGKYCVHLVGESNPTTKLTQEIYVSSDLITTVAFGIVKE